MNGRTQRNPGGGPSRRQLLVGGLSALGAGWMARRAGLGGPAAISLAGPSTDYRALVCVYLVGGNDSYNLLIPSTGSAYANYAAARSELAIPQGDLLGVGSVGHPAQEMGFHPQLPKLRQRFLDGDLAVLANIGPLQGPTSLSDVENKAPHVPAHLFSHTDQSRFWQGTAAAGTEALGWGARTVEHLAALNAGADLPAAISLGGSNTWQRGLATTPYTIGPGGAPSYLGFDSGLGPARLAVLEGFLGEDSPNELVDALAERHDRSFAFGATVQTALGDSSEHGVSLPADNELATELEAVARLASMHASLGVSRQVFFCRVHGFDTHTGHLAAQPELFRLLDDALAFFQDSLDAYGLGDCVTTFTASEFGRSLSSNGKGCDHGWGGHQLALGGAVQGGAAYGTWPTLELDGPDDVGFGRLLPSTAVDQMSATLARWMGVAPTDLPLLFPNLSSFGTTDLGFLA